MKLFLQQSGSRNSEESFDVSYSDLSIELDAIRLFSCHLSDT